MRVGARHRCRSWSGVRRRSFRAARISRLRASRRRWRSGGVVPFGLRRIQLLPADRADARVRLAGRCYCRRGVARRSAEGAGPRCMAVGGGFATPFLVGSGQDAQITLFTYDAVLVCGTLFLAQRHDWPVLNALSFLFTWFTIGGVGIGVLLRARSGCGPSCSSRSSASCSWRSCAPTCGTAGVTWLRLSSAWVLCSYHACSMPSFRATASRSGCTSSPRLSSPLL